MTIRLSRRALADLDHIRDYTIQTWGRDQWLVYYWHLALTFERITENPAIGRARDLFVPGMRSLNCQKHVVFYKCLKQAEGSPVVLRIIHQKRNMPALIYYEDLDG